jgi:hypothetical protein
MMRFLLLTAARSSVLAAAPPEQISLRWSELGAAAIAIAANDIDLYEGPALCIFPAVAAGGTIGLGIGGYYIGKATDKRVTNIRVLPDRWPVA